MKADGVVKHRTFLSQGQKAKVNINFYLTGQWSLSGFQREQICLCFNIIL